MTLPLAGIRVVSFEQSVSGPLCSRLLADLGAEVIKVEPPGRGDLARHWDSIAAGNSSYFVWLNRGKRSFCIDTRSSSGRSLLRRVIVSGDVFVQNAAPGVIETLGLSYETLKADKPSLVYCSVSGYGSSGPYGSRKAYDLLVQGETGALLLTGSASEPAKTAIPVCDIAAAMAATQGILAALYRREIDGSGAHVAVTMFGAVIDWLGGLITGVANGGQQPMRSGARHNIIVPSGPFLASDGVFVNIAVQQEDEWIRFCTRVLLAPDLLTRAEFQSNQLRVANRRVLEPIIEAVIATQPASAWEDRLTRADIAFGSVRSLDGVLMHPQAEYLRLVEEIEQDGRVIRTVAPQIRFDGYSPHRRLPEIGQDSTAVLVELGLTEEEIEGLHVLGVVPRYERAKS